MDAPSAATLLERERQAWLPFEALGGLTDAELDQSVAAAHDWSARDLIAHLIAWLGDAIDVAHELTVGATSETRITSRQGFTTRGDEINSEIEAAWRRLPIEEVRRRLHDVPVELRRAATAVPDERWLADPENLRFIEVYSIGHYADHVDDLREILAAAALGGAEGMTHRNSGRSPA